MKGLVVGVANCLIFAPFVSLVLVQGITGSGCDIVEIGDASINDGISAVHKMPMDVLHYHIEY